MVGTMAACGGIGLRARGAIGRGGSADIRGRGFGSDALGSDALISDALISDALAMSREICCWPALSCSTLALSCSISCRRLATSFGTEAGGGAGSADGAAAVAAAPWGAG